MKKHIRNKLESKKKSLFTIGMAFSTALALVAFEYRSDYLVRNLDGADFTEDWVEDQIREVTVIEKKLKKLPEPEKKPKKARLNPVENKTIVEPKAEDKLIDLVEPEIGDFEMKKEVVDEPPILIDEPGIMATFPGGEAAWQTYLTNTIDYPREAARMGIQGNVYLSFVVTKDGKVSDVKVLRGIHPSCDKEAVEAIKNSPKWEAAIQRGIPVNVRMRVPVSFRLKP